MEKYNNEIKDKLYLCLKLIKEGNFIHGKLSDDFKRIPFEISEKLGIDVTNAMAIVGYLLDLKYIRLVTFEGFKLTDDPIKLKEVEETLQEIYGE